MSEKVAGTGKLAVLDGDRSAEVHESMGNFNGWVEEV
jgi:hypothetical protein